MANQNPPCPKCGSDSGVHRHLDSGNISYRCFNKACQHTWTPNRKNAGRPAKYGRPMTAAERMRESRAKKKNR